MRAANLSKEWSEKKPSHSLCSLATKAAKPWTQPTFTSVWPYLIIATRVTIQYTGSNTINRSQQLKRD